MTDDKQKPELWVKVVEAHTYKAKMALILISCAGFSLIVLTIGAVVNNIQNPSVTDLSANYMTLLGTLLGSVFTGSIGYIAGQNFTKKDGNNEETFNEGDIELKIKPPDEPL